MENKAAEHRLEACAVYSALRLNRLVLWVLLSMAGGCGTCGAGTEEERLANLLEARPVKAYAGARMLLAGAGSDPAAAKVRDAIVPMFVAPDTPEKLADRVAALRRLAEALEAAAEVRGVPDRPLVPVLLGIQSPGAAPPAGWGIDEDHAVVGTAWLVLRAHEQTKRFALWELTRIEKAGLERSPLRLVARAARAVTFAQHDLCKMAADESAALRAEDGVAALGDALAFFDAGARAGSSEPEKILPAVRALASGMTAHCFQGRKDTESALPHLEALCDDAVLAGLPETKVAAVRAYIAFKRGDRDRALAAMRVARTDPDLSAEDRSEVDRLIGHLERHSDGDFVAGIEDKLEIAGLAWRISRRAVDRSGVGERIAASGPGSAVDRFTTRIGEAVGSADPGAALKEGAGRLGEELDRLRGKTGK